MDAPVAPPTEHTRLLVATAPLSYDEHDVTKRSASAVHARAKTAGLLVLFALIWSWVLQAEAAQMLQTSMSFNKPFFVVGFNHTFMAILLPLVVWFHKLRGGPEERASWLDFAATLGRHSVIPMPKLMRIAAFLSAFYCVADYFWYKALANVSVAAGTAIFNCSPLFVYCFSICFLHESVAMKKLCGVFTSFVGVMLILMFQGGENRLDVSSPALTSLESASFIAGLLMVASAACYAGYEVAFQVAVGEDITDTSTLLTLTGLAGLFTIPYWVCGSVVLAMSPFPALYEPLGWPDTLEGIAMLVASGCFGFVFNIFLPLSICWTSPLETSVGCMLTIPLSALIDASFHHTRFVWQCVVGTALVLGGFGMLECASSTWALETGSIKPDSATAVV
uniref:EamA domain-containing protein n=1 Tax=Globisporangium ultimum (strain ATCC 200006 / CBS 805.95 / DAOM BR144) TaxID=431595 RepID=K3WBV6_GLOUD